MTEINPVIGSETDSEVLSFVAFKLHGDIFCVMPLSPTNNGFIIINTYSIGNCNGMRIIKRKFCTKCNKTGTYIRFDLLIIT